MELNLIFRGKTMHIARLSIELSKPIQISNQLKKDIIEQVGSIHTMNCPNMVGYAFNTREDKNEISIGMFVSDHEKTTWYNIPSYKQFNLFFDCKTRKTHEILYKF